MIELTVKTLDSQNHPFTVEDDITVAQFKEKIADTVNIPADTQRIIYCGRVLQDSSKLSEYDVNGKVVHLVQRPPPLSSPRPESPPPQQNAPRRIRGFEYLGSMRFPANAFDHNAVPPLPTHSLAASRLNVAKRMLRRAELVLQALENPTGRPADQPTPLEPFEEVTPVFEARVIVPNVRQGSALDDQNILAAVERSLLNSAGLTSNRNIPTNDSVPNNNPAAETHDNAETVGVHSVSSTPEIISPLTASSENIAAAAADEPGVPTGEFDENEDAINSAPAENTANNATNENISRTSEYAEILSSLNRFNVRLAPFLEQYNNFMTEDPTVVAEDARQTQAMINRVSEILHYLGHLYHSLSDIIVRVRTPPPRPLMCRPILIQHSAIVQAGIPIQVEAQINFSSERNNGPGNGNSNSNSNGNGNNATSTTTTTQQTPTNNTGPSITAHMQPTMVGFPFLPGAGVRVETFHLPASNVDRMNGNRNNNNNNSYASAVSGSESTQSRIPPGDPPTADSNTVNENATPLNNTNETVTSTSNANETSNQVPLNNPNVEFFMEVTPESITIDSLETSFLGANQANDILQGGINPPPTELFQSIMQMAGHLINRGAQNAAATTTTPNTSTTDVPSSDAQTSTTVGSAARTVPFQNSQARGNTQTQPTMATNTRSTPRPHVHLAQHAMQGFDPFLPCNSHHVTPRRRTPGSNQQNGNQQPGNRAADGSAESRTVDPSHPLYNIIRHIINSVRSGYSTQQSTRQPPPQNVTVNASSSSQNPTPMNMSPPTWMSTLQNMNLSDSSVRAPTIAQLFQQLPDATYTEGESVFTDLIMLLSRHLTVGDVMHVNSGRLEPLMRIRSQLRHFFLYRILDGMQGTAAVDRGVERLLSEIQPLLAQLSALETRDDIDIVRSVQTLLRARLPNIITLVVSRNPNSLKMVIDQFRITGRQLWALALRASRNGRHGVENVFDSILARYMEGIPRYLQQWTLRTGRAQISLILSSLDVPESILQPYIVRDVDAVTSAASEQNPQSEPMQVEQEALNNENVSNVDEITTNPINLAEDTEPLPPVVLGSEAWHGQVPADWVPIITRDSQRQRRQNSQAPFSDAYLSGMPSKRRKIVSNSKPQGSLPQVISEGVRRAVTVSGLAGVTPIENVAHGAGTDVNIQSAYRELLRTTVQSSLRGNEDFTPERFPNASSYFNNHH